MENFPGWTVQFELLFRQEQSRHASGRTRVKDFGTPIWMATYQSVPLRPNALDEWRARLAALGNGLGTFKAWPSSRCWPIAQPGGTTAVPSNWVLASGNWSDSGLWLTDAPWTIGAITGGTIATIGTDRSSITVADSNAIWSVGDYVEINGRWLHQVTGVSGGLLSLVPHLSVGALVGQSVGVYRPGVLMSIVPGSVSTTAGLNGRGTVTFQAIEARG